jgi:NAD(P)-dependent dehydrogenase (short-subunit alcohol dehydrogenase family)
MGQIFITGSMDGLGLATARTLMAEGHDVLLHARSQERASALADQAPRAAGSSSATQQRRPDPSDRRAGQRHRAHGRRHPQRSRRDCQRWVLASQETAKPA